MTAFFCPTCKTQTREPSTDFGRSYCPTCQDYVHPEKVEVEVPEVRDPEVRVTAPGGETFEVIPVQIGVDSCEDAYALLEDGTDADLEDLVILRPLPSPASRPDTSESEGKNRPFSDFRAEGLLWWVNRVAFHPRGHALAFHVEEDGTVTGWTILGDGSEPWAFTEQDDDEGFEATEAFFAALVEEEADPGPIGTVDG